MSLTIIQFYPILLYSISFKVFLCNIFLLAYFKPMFHLHTSSDVLGGIEMEHWLKMG